MVNPFKEFDFHAVRSARRMAKDVFKGIREGKSAGEIVSSLSSRLQMWGFTGRQALNKGVLEAPEPEGGDIWSLIWDYQDGKDHCKDCSRLDGVVLTREEWSKIGIKPQSRDLECKGYNCGCYLSPTGEPSIGLEAASRLLS